MVSPDWTCPPIGPDWTVPRLDPIGDWTIGMVSPDWTWCPPIGPIGRGVPRLDVPRLDLENGVPRLERKARRDLGGAREVYRTTRR